MSREEYWPEDHEDPRDHDNDHALNCEREEQDGPFSSPADALTRAMHGLEFTCDELQGSIAAKDYVRLREVGDALTYLTAWHTENAKRRAWGAQSAEQTHEELNKLSRGEVPA